jgi:hypothetical protein
MTPTTPLNDELTIVLAKEGLFNPLISVHLGNNMIYQCKQRFNKIDIFDDSGQAVASVSRSNITIGQAKLPIRSGGILGRETFFELDGVEYVMKVRNGIILVSRQNGEIIADFKMMMFFRKYGGIRIKLDALYSRLHLAIIAIIASQAFGLRYSVGGLVFRGIAVTATVVTLVLV